MVAFIQRNVRLPGACIAECGGHPRCSPSARPAPQEAAWRAKKAEEARLAAEAAAAAVAAAEAEDRRKADEAVAELKAQYAAWREGALKEEAGRWKMVPAVSRLGGRGGAWAGCCEPEGGPHGWVGGWDLDW